MYNSFCELYKRTLLKYNGDQKPLKTGRKRKAKRVVYIKNK